MTLQGKARSSKVGHSAHELDVNQSFKSTFTELINAHTFVADNTPIFQNILEYAQ